MKITYKALRPWLLGLCLVIAISVGGYYLYKEFFIAPDLPNAQARSVTSDAPAQSNPPSNNEKQSFTVPASHPRRIIISTLNIDALIKPMGVTRTGAIDAPATAWDAGWYTKSGLPGNKNTPMLLDGHVNDAANTPGIFFNLNTLKTGDTVTIERGDLSLIHYEVTKVTQKPLDEATVAPLLQPTTEATLHIITCGGTYNAATQTYSDRIIVSAATPSSV